jgi:hypothetical protein
MAKQHEYQIKLQRIRGEVEYKMVVPDASLKQILPTDCKQVFIGGKTCTDFNLTLQQLDLPQLIVLPNAVVTPRIIYLRNRNETTKINFQGLQKVKDLEKVIDISIGYFYLKFGWQILLSENYLSEYGITNGSTIELFLSTPEAVRRVKSIWSTKECAICLEKLSFNSIAQNAIQECCHCFHVECTRTLTKCPFCNLPWLQYFESTSSSGILSTSLIVNADITDATYSI